MGEAASRRASLNNKRQSPLVKAEPIYDNVEIIKHTKKTNIENVKTPSRRTNTPKGRSTAGRKYKRGDGRRFQTIGYDGEVRSPLRERQTNIVATVQRSKSARNASSSLNTKKAVTKKETSSIFNDKE